MKGAGARAILDVLRDGGVEVVFTCPGSTEAAILDASIDYAIPRTILTTHESIAMAAADGYARATGMPAVAYLHANVGLANAVAHLHCAALAKSPVVILNGVKSTAIANRGGFTTAPYPAEYVRQHVKTDRVALRSDALAEETARALRIARTQPTGPVYLGLPQDLVEADVAIPMPDLARQGRPAAPRPSAEATAAAAALLAGARAIAIVAGSEIARAGAEDALLALAERLEAVVLLEDRRTIATNGVAATGPAFAGTYALANPAVRDCDLLFFAGMPSPMEFEPPQGPLAPAVPTIHLSVDAEAIGKIVPVDVGLVGDPRAALHDLLAALPAAAARPERAAYRAASVGAYAANAAAARAAARARQDESPIAVPALVELLATHLPDDCVVVGDPVTSGAAVLERLICGSRRTYHTTSGGSLGWGMAAALGFALAYPGRRIVSIIGDGVFQFGVQTLWTAAQLGLAITFVVIDNASYAAVRAAVKRYRGTNEGPFPASDLGGIDIAAVSRGFGAYAVRVERLQDLVSALDAAGAHAGPSVIDVHTDPHDTGPA